MWHLMVSVVQIYQGPPIFFEIDGRLESQVAQPAERPGTGFNAKYGLLKLVFSRRNYLQVVSKNLFYITEEISSELRSLLPYYPFGERGNAHCRIREDNNMEMLRETKLRRKMLVPMKASEVIFYGLFVYGVLHLPCK